MMWKMSPAVCRFRKWALNKLGCGYNYLRSKAGLSDSIDNLKRIFIDVIVFGE